MSVNSRSVSRLNLARYRDKFQPRDYSNPSSNFMIWFLEKVKQFDHEKCSKESLKVQVI